MKTAEYYVKVKIESLADLPKDMLIRYFVMFKDGTYCKDKRLQYYNELAALNAQLAEQQSTPVKQAFDKPGFFESQMEDGTLRKELIKIVKWMCDENISRFCDPDKIVNEYLNSKE